MDLLDGRDGAARTTPRGSPGPTSAEILLAVHAALLDLAAPPDDDGLALSDDVAAASGPITARRVS
ncbi:MAG: hypothetical protein ACYCTH_06585 [Cellulomonas sp.]